MKLELHYNEFLLHTVFFSYVQNFDLPVVFFRHTLYIFLQTGQPVDYYDTISPAHKNRTYIKRTPFTICYGQYILRSTVTLHCFCFCSTGSKVLPIMAFFQVLFNFTPSRYQPRFYFFCNSAGNEIAAYHYCWHGNYINN